MGPRENAALESRSRWFDEHVTVLEHNSTRVGESDGVYRCPCCGYATLGERGGFGICDVCYWEDDGQDDRDADRVRGGPNGSLSLSRARANYQDFGACEITKLKFVRRPLPDEL